MSIGDGTGEDGGHVGVGSGFGGGGVFVVVFVVVVFVVVVVVVGITVDDFFSEKGSLDTNFHFPLSKVKKKNRKRGVLGGKEKRKSNNERRERLLPDSPTEFV